MIAKRLDKERTKKKLCIRDYAKPVHKNSPVAAAA